MELFQHLPPPRYNNKAGRLHQVLTRACLNPDNMSTYVVWRRVLFAGEQMLPPTQKGTDEQILEVTAAFMRLFNVTKEIEEAIKVIRPDDAQVYLSEFPKIYKTFMQLNMAAPFGEQRRHITEGVLARLEHCAKDLPQESIISKEDLDAIWDATNDLIKFVRDAELPMALRSWLLRLLGQVQQSINYYWINGGEGLREGLAILIGESELGSHVFAASTLDEKTATTITEKLRGLTITIYGVATKVGALKPLVDVGIVLWDKIFPHTTGTAVQMIPVIQEGVQKLIT